MDDGRRPRRRTCSGQGPDGAGSSPAAGIEGSRPSGYPREYELLLELRDGGTIQVRPILPGDAPALKAAIEQADPDTVRRRFLGARPRVTPKLLAWLTVLDYRQRFALVAIDPQEGRGIAIARYVCVDDGVAEVALVVDPAWRRRGVATLLAELLAQAAVERGIHTFTAYYMAENSAVTHLLKLSAGQRQQSIKDGSTDAVVALDRAQIAAAISQLAGQASAEPSADESPSAAPRPAVPPSSARPSAEPPSSARPSAAPRSATSRPAAPRSAPGRPRKR